MFKQELSGIYFLSRKRYEHGQSYASDGQLGTTGFSSFMYVIWVCCVRIFGVLRSDSRVDPAREAGRIYPRAP